jgi:hypothetical protein
MKAGTWKRAVALIVSLAYLSTGCANLQTVPLAGGNARPDVKVGESVVVTTTSGTRQKFDVTAVEDAALIGAGVRVPYSDIARLEVDRGGTAVSKKALWIGAAVLGAVAIAATAGSSGGSGGGY